MIKFENLEVLGLETVINGLITPAHGSIKSDSGICKGGDSGIGCAHCASFIQNGCNHEYDNSFQVGRQDYDRMLGLAIKGSVHAKFRRMLTVYVDIIAPLYWWREFDTYKVDAVPTYYPYVQPKDFTLNDFSHEYLDEYSLKNLASTLETLNFFRNLYVGNTGVDKYHAYEDSPKSHTWWQIVQLLPNSYNQRRTIMTNYEVLADQYITRPYQTLDEWPQYFKWIEQLPLSALMTDAGHP